MSVDKTVCAAVRRVREVACEVYKATAGRPEQVYDGSYLVTPGFERQRIVTQGKTMRADMVVDAIAVSRTADPSGGNTIYIGGNRNGE